jgi:hypothetical protein
LERVGTTAIRITPCDVNNTSQQWEVTDCSIL